MPAPAASLSPPPPLLDEDYAFARQRFRTTLLRRGPAPDPVLPLDPPPGASRIAYRSGNLTLAAWLSEAPRSTGAKAPGVLVLHGGDVLSGGHWEDLAKPFVAAGFVAMIPSLRGENGQDGAYSGFYDENADVLAALDALAADPRVDSERLFVAGHSMGGTQTLLAALSSPRIRSAAAFSGAPDAVRFFRRFPDMLRFDPKNRREYEMRSAVCFATSFKCPVRLWHGTEETRAVEPARLTVERARAAGLDVATAALPGAHSTALPGEIARAIAFFSGNGRAG
jgi:dipeptidyl aminopeptidase/acylaminoacyl peptidase